MAGREPGFEGLLAAGRTPREAWQEIHDSLTPEAMAVITELTETPEGRETLAWSRRRWALRGLNPPWETEP